MNKRIKIWILRFIALILILSPIITLVACSGGNSAKITDGNYTGATKGYGGELSVNVIIKDGKITGLDVTGHSETPEYGGRAIDELPARIIDKNSLGVDVVAGATITSRAIFKAAADAITKAGGDPIDYKYTAIEEIRLDDIITVIGLPNDKTAEFTGEQIMAMESVAVDTISLNSSGTEKPVHAVGTTLETLLGSLGVSQKNYAAIILSSTDGYTIEIPDAVLLNRDIVIAWEYNGEPINLRVIVPDERAMYWIKFLSKIELIDAIEEVQTDTINLLETMIANLQDKAEDYKYHDNTDKAIPVSVIFEQYITPKPTFVSLSSVDELSKNDRYDTIAAQYIKFTGESSPMFTGPQLPEGMRVKEIISMKIENVVILSFESAAKKTGVNIGDGIAVNEIFRLSGMKEAVKYKFTGDDGYEVVIDASDITNGRITVENDKIVVRFDGLEKNTTVKGLLKISVE
jgi:uncharacterized protein with FMN-binding domain